MSRSYDGPLTRVQLKVLSQKMPHFVVLSEDRNERDALLRDPQFDLIHALEIVANNMSEDNVKKLGIAGDHFDLLRDVFPMKTKQSQMREMAGRGLGFGDVVSAVAKTGLQLLPAIAPLLL